MDLLSARIDSCTRLAERIFRNSLRGSFVEWLHKPRPSTGQCTIAPAPTNPRLNNAARRRPHAASHKNFLRTLFVQSNAQRERIAGRIWDVVELADRRDVRFTVRTVESFGDVEDDVGLSLLKLLWEGRV